MATHAEKEFYHLIVSVALNGLEAPLKTKHARSIIIMIHKAKEAKTFWMIISRQPLMQSRFTAWKFSHLLHKVLREAHESSIRHSQSHKKMILEVGKMWGLLQDDIGCCIQAYSKLLATKLNFHDKNQMFPGSLNISFTELFIAVDRDLNYCFQLCVEIFDYLEDIIALQLTIFSSMEKYRMSSMTPQGQCRLAPIVCLIQDSNALYDLSVRLMFKLHDGVPYDVVSGHRDRFHGLFLKLKSFYNNVRPLQYFKDLITVPELPDSSPNFKSQNDFTSYVPPVVHVPQEPDPVVEDLVDTNNHEAEAFSQAQQQLSMLEGIISEKEAGIEELSFKLVNLQKNFHELQQCYKHDIQELLQNNTVLSNDLVLAREMQNGLNPILLQKAMEEEERHKLSSEKFNKRKSLYTKIRENLRKQSNCNKSTAPAPTPISAPTSGFCSLQNLGNTCFLNAVVYALRSIHMATEAIHSAVRIRNETRVRGVMEELHEALMEMRKGDARGRAASLRPTALLQSIQAEWPTFAQGEQHDAHELLLLILGLLETNRTIPETNCFEGIERQTKKCLTCGSLTPTEQKFTGMSMPCVDPVAHIRDSIAALKKNRLTCCYCGELTDSEQQVSYPKLPEILVIQINRFSETMEKVQDYVPSHFMLNCFCTSCKESGTDVDKRQEHHYNLRAVVVHNGELISSGHYLAYTAIPNVDSGSSNCCGMAPNGLNGSLWLEANDNIVKTMMVDDVREELSIPHSMSTPYIYIYQRNGPSPPPPATAITKQNPKKDMFTRCRYCGKLYHCRTIYSHILHMHERPTTAKFICNKCGKRYYFKTSLTQHMSVAHKTHFKTYTCPHCNKLYRNKGSLNANSSFKEILC
ncbi:huntingtin-interacting protein 1-related protein-like [Drosophila takahashii]|uniref:huntingtin-interacting protein 1-related protein-like n=1 Tax=Drosophila takahashii TaxID=29030 RepID=UPI0038991473